jgi:bifunctional non-homologous end joining protein LigD
MAERVNKRKARSTACARLPSFLEPMQAKPVESLPPGNWIYEIKFDGYRAIALRGGDQVRILSRNEKDLGRKFLEVTNSISQLDVQDAIIDGEIVALDEKGRSSFQLLQAFEMGQERPRLSSTPLTSCSSMGMISETYRWKNERRNWKSC